MGLGDIYKHLDELLGLYLDVSYLVEGQLRHRHRNIDGHFDRYRYTILHQVCTNIYSQQRMRVFIVPHTHQHWVLSKPLISTNLVIVCNLNASFKESHNLDPTIQYFFVPSSSFT